VPNLVSGVRLLGTVPLLWLAWNGERTVFLGLFLFLMATDWVDGKLATALHQESELGARLDSAADVLVYGAVALSLWWLERSVILDNLGLVLGAIGTWWLSAFVCLGRFGRLPSYHTRAAKLGWLIAGVASLVLIFNGNAVAFPWALGWVALTNLEAVAIGFVLPEWRANVPSIVNAVRVRRRAREAETAAWSRSPEHMDRSS
jgi:cardiolipin synthase